MKTQYHTIQELIEQEKSGDPSAPMPVSSIPNNMGVNLCSVEGMSWTRQDDGQLVSLTIHFIPDCSD